MSASQLAPRYGAGRDTLERVHARARSDTREGTGEGVALRTTSRSRDAAVELRGVGKRYGERVVLNGFDLAIERGSFVSIVGRSGCGKSTLLRLIAGLEIADEGAVERRGANGAVLDTRIMFQDARLLPWKTVLQNVMLGLGLGRGAREDARAVLNEVGLLERADEWPARLSGGQKQRVALGDRILLVEAGRIALDEAVALERPRARVDARFAALEGNVLQYLLKTGSQPTSGRPA